MPLCIRCSNPNPPQSPRCSQCGAVLPRVAGEEPPSSGLLALEEGRSYQGPTQQFETENLARLREYLQDYLEFGDETAVRDWLGHLNRELEEFATQGVAGLKDALAADQQLSLPDDFQHQVSYLVSKGIRLCENGLAGLASALNGQNPEALNDQNAEALEHSFDEFRLGNDHLCTAVLLMAERKEAIDQVLDEATETEDFDEA